MAGKQFGITLKVLVRGGTLVVWIERMPWRDSSTRSSKRAPRDWWWSIKESQVTVRCYFHERLPNRWKQEVSCSRNGIWLKRDAPVLSDVKLHIFQEAWANSLCIRDTLCFESFFCFDTKLSFTQAYCEKLEVYNSQCFWCQSILFKQLSGLMHAMGGEGLGSQSQGGFWMEILLPKLRFP